MNGLEIIKRLQELKANKLRTLNEKNEYKKLYDAIYCEASDLQSYDIECYLRFDDSEEAWFKYSVERNLVIEALHETKGQEVIDYAWSWQQESEVACGTTCFDEVEVTEQDVIEYLVKENELGNWIEVQNEKGEVLDVANN